jgi:hypothetical protein
MTETPRIVCADSIHSWHFGSRKAASMRNRVIVVTVHCSELKERQMGQAIYNVIPYKSGWGVSHDGSTVGPYETKEAAYEATVAAGSIALKDGHELQINVPGRSTVRTAVA